jgi:[ribosomal protein S5]-alanine N-acetyltransferase
MLIFGKRSLDRPDLVFGGKRVLLRPPQREDFDAWAALRESSRAFLQPWEPLWPEDDLTPLAFRKRVTRYHAEIGKDEAYPFFVFSADGQNLMGGLNLTNVRRGAASMASLGYWMGQSHAGQGLMTEAVNLVIPFAASRLRLRRIEAACVPENRVSIRLLEKTAFVHEGYAHQYLAINGAWRDHLLFARQTAPSENRVI